MPRSVRMAAFIAGLLAVAPVAAAQVLPEPIPVPAKQRSLPRLAAYLDTAGLRLALAKLPPHADARRSARILAITFDTSGQSRPPRPAVDVLMPPATRDTLVALVRAHLRPIAPLEHVWETAVLLETGPGARVEEVVLDRRMASVANPGRLSRRLETAASDLLRDDEALAGRELRVRLGIVIDSEGLLDSLRVVSGSGNARVDSAAVRLVRATLFVPMRIEGEPVASKVVLPLRFLFER